MPPKLDPNGDSELIAVRLTPELTAALDAEVMRQRAENPDVYIGRSNVLRALVRKALLATARRGPPRPLLRPSSRHPSRHPSSASRASRGPAPTCPEGCEST